jgi:hypothetical protein
MRDGCGREPAGRRVRRPGRRASVRSVLDVDTPQLLHQRLEHEVRSFLHPDFGENGDLIIE